MTIAAASVDTRRRAERLQAGLGSWDVDGYLITQPANLYYFAGIRIRTAVLLVADGVRPRLLVREQNQDGVGQAADWCDAAVLPGGGAWESAVAGALGSRLPRRTGCDDLALSMAAKLRAAAPNVALSPRAEIAASLRRKKGADEEALLRQAAAIADAAAGAAFATIRPGISELVVVAEMEASLRRAGADGTRFPTRFGSGLGSADCDVEPSRKLVREGEMGFFDIGPVYDGYLGDISRGFVVGRPSVDQTRIIGVVLEALERAADLLRPDVPVTDLCAVVHRTFDRVGLGHAFRHHLGHGLGLAMDPPLIRSGSTDRLEEGDLVALEPGLYLPGLGGVRFENDYRIGCDGPELLTRFPLSFVVEHTG